MRNQTVTQTFSWWDLLSQWAIVLNVFIASLLKFKILALDFFRKQGQFKLKKYKSSGLLTSSPFYEGSLIRFRSKLTIMAQEVIGNKGHYHLKVWGLRTGLLEKVCLLHFLFHPTRSNLLLSLLKLWIALSEGRKGKESFQGSPAGLCIPQNEDANQNHLDVVVVTQSSQWRSPDLAYTVIAVMDPYLPNPTYVKTGVQGGREEAERRF